MDLPDEMAPPADHNQRLIAAQAQAAWHLGDSSWADQILDIYLGREEPDEEAVQAWET